MRKVKGDDIIIPLTCELFNLPPPPFEGYAVIFFKNVIARCVQQVSLPVKNSPRVLVVFELGFVL